MGGGSVKSEIWRISRIIINDLAIFKNTRCSRCLQIKAMIISVGGSPEPIIFSLKEVKCGAEVFITGHNPWNLYAVEQREKLCLYFNSYQFTACQESVPG